VLKDEASPAFGTLQTPYINNWAAIPYFVKMLPSDSFPHQNSAGFYRLSHLRYISRNEEEIKTTLVKTEGRRGRNKCRGGCWGGSKFRVVLAISRIRSSGSACSSRSRKADSRSNTNSPGRCFGRQTSRGKLACSPVAACCQLPSPGTSSLLTIAVTVLPISTSGGATSLANLDK
jgi:hypothetical protein